MGSTRVEQNPSLNQIGGQARVNEQASLRPSSETAAEETLGLVGGTMPNLPQPPSTIVTRTSMTRPYSTQPESSDSQAFQESHSLRQDINSAYQQTFEQPSGIDDWTDFGWIPNQPFDNSNSVHGIDNIFQLMDASFQVSDQMYDSYFIS